MYPISRCVLLLALLLASALVPGDARPEPLSTPATGTLSIRHDRGRIDVWAEEVPLGRVLSELARQSAGQISFAAPATAQWPVSVSVEGIPLVDGIKEILDGFSYAIYRVADTWRVIVLSPQLDPASTRSTTADTGRQRDAGTAAAAFQSNARGDESWDARAEVEQQEDPSLQLAPQQEHQEALLHHALEALNSANTRLHAEAIDQLVGMADPRATQALVEVASNSGTAADVKLRVQAVHALWRHAADLRFSDEASAAALKQLAEDSNNQVAKAARQAVSSMEQYQQQQAH